MTPDELFKAFHCLGPSEKREVVLRLPTELKPLDQCLLREIVNTLDLRKDGIGELLPGELVAIIFSYLDPKAPFRLNSVSRGWKEKLETLQYPTLRIWYGPNWAEAFRPEDIKDKKRVEQLRRVEQLHRLMDFRPHWAQRLQIHGHGPDLLTPTADLDHAQICKVAVVGDSFIYITPGAREVRIANLRTGSHWTASTPARKEIVGALTWSDKVFAFLTYGQAHVYTLSGDKQKHLTLPNAGRNSTPRVVCNGRNVAIISAISDATNQRVSFNVGVWNIDKPEGASLQVQHPAITSPVCGTTLRQAVMSTVALPDTEFETVTLFFQESGRHTPTTNGTSDSNGKNGSPEQYTARIRSVRYRISNKEVCKSDSHIVNLSHPCLSRDIQHVSVHMTSMPGYFIFITSCEHGSCSALRVWSSQNFRFEVHPSPFTWKPLPLEIDPIPSFLIDVPLNGGTAWIGPNHNCEVTSFWGNETWLVWQYTYDWFAAEENAESSRPSAFTKVGFFCFEKGLKIAPEAIRFIENRPS